MRRPKAAKSARSKRGRSRPIRARRGTRVDAVEAALAALAHEVRTPLNGILAFGELLAASHLPERERGWAAAIKSAAEHLAHLTTVVVDGARADRRKLVLRSYAFRPRQLAEVAAGTLRARAETKGLAATAAIADDLPHLVVGDRVRLRAALENLIDNAVKFTDRGQVAVAVTGRPAGRGRIRLIFTFKDSGIGLSAAEVKRLFRPFAQASKAVAHRFGGAGLGLTFVKRIAQAMGGDLTVESAPGRGSEFRLEVVVAAKSGESPERKKAAQPHVVTSAKSLRILCAEDNPYGRVVLNTILTELGHRADFVDTGGAAVEAVGRGVYDVVLMDVTLPDLDGIAATRLIRGLPSAGARLPIIGISGRSEASEQAAARAAGMNAYLTKPVSPAAIASLLTDLA
jgi:CheY-like chemotaxis protein/nitrogen-specific signal transduction histidine kinase